MLLRALAYLRGPARKAGVAIATAGATAASLGLLDEQVSKWVAVVLVSLGAFGVHAVKNTDG